MLSVANAEALADVDDAGSLNGHDLHARTRRIARLARLRNAQPPWVAARTELRRGTTPEQRRIWNARDRSGLRTARPVSPHRRADRPPWAALANPTRAALRAARIVDDTALRDRIIAAVREPGLSLVPLLVDLVRAATTLPPIERTTMGLGIIAQHCYDALDTSLTQPPRASDDWSITEFERGTCCQDCATLAAFLADPAIQQVTWPLAKPRRQHIHHRLDEAELPVTHHTTRQGGPHKLVITKTPDLHLRDTERRRARKESLATVQQFLNATD